jgi:hypothetical protein
MSNEETMVRAQFSIDGDVKFTTIDGEIHGLDLWTDFHRALKSAVDLLLSNDSIDHVLLMTGHKIKLLHKETIRV